MMIPIKTFTLPDYLKRQYWIFTMMLGSTFLVASLLMSTRATINQHEQDCHKFLERLNDVSEILVREAVLKSTKTISFELDKLKSEFNLTAIDYQKSPGATTANGVCSVSLSGYSIHSGLMFGSSEIGSIYANRNTGLFSLKGLSGILFPVSLSFFASFLILYWLRKKFERMIVGPLVAFATDIKRADANSEVAIDSKLAEYISLQNSTNDLLSHIRQSTERIRLLEVSEEIAKLSKQVAHDIRSPLSALSMLQSQLSTLPEEHRSLIKAAIQRINDIANELLRKGRDHSQEGRGDSSIQLGEPIGSQSYLVSTLIDSLISEKRMEFRSRFRLVLDLDLSSSYGLFASVSAQKLQRSVSNIINNAVEALPNSNGTVSIKVSPDGPRVKVRISDNGVGIPTAILKQIGQYGFSHGKVGDFAGTGLGVKYAIDTVNEVGGSFLIRSRSIAEFGAASCGTDVELTMPTSRTPSWFKNCIRVDSKGRVLIVDDDQSIHEIWNSRFTSHPLLCQSELIHFSSPIEASVWLAEHGLNSNDVALIDHEFLGFDVNGLDIIERFGIQKNATLVTGRFDETEVLIRCERLKVKLIPKSQAPIVPLLGDAEILPGISENNLGTSFASDFAAKLSIN